MKALLKQIPPMLRWGFLVSAAVLATLFVVRSWWIASLSAQWEEDEPMHQGLIADDIRSMFMERVEALAAAAASVAGDRDLLAAVTSNRPGQVIEGNRRLEQHRNRPSLSLLIVDPKGTSLAWAGRSLVNDTAPLLSSTSADTILVISRLKLRSSVTAAVVSPVDGLVVAASEPLEVNVPLSNRFISQSSIVSDIAKRVGLNIQVLGSENTVPSEKGTMRVELSDFSGGKAAAVLVALPNPDQELQSFQNAIGGWIGLSASLLVILAALACVQFLPGLKSRVLKVAAAIVIIWGVRLALLALRSPSELMGGFLFDPTVFASPFANGLASSLGETLLSVLALLGTMVVIVREAFRPERMRAGTRKSWWLAVLPLGSIMLIAVLRAYGATLRSLVYDSTLQFTDPAALFPGGALIVMYGIVILLTVALILFLVSIVAAMVRSLERAKPSWLHSSGLAFLALVYALCVIGFLFINRVPQFPGYFPFLALGCALALVLLLERAGGMTWLRTIPGVSLLIMAAFILSVPVLDQKVHTKEEDRLRVFADEVVRPVDAWLSFVVSESFNSLGPLFQEIGEDIPGDEPETDIAFPVWTKTLLSREGYNSALVLYSLDGIETSRFSVGLTNYEQTQLLTRLFDVAEERLNVVERRVPEGLIKYYGMWGTIRDDAGRPVVIAAVLLSASERALFRGEAPELLRTLGPWSGDRRYRQMIISEYVNGYLVATNDEERMPGIPLPDGVRSHFAGSGQKYLERADSSNGRVFESLYVKDESQQDRIVSISVEEVGLRWHVYNIVKVSLIYVSALVLAAAVLVLIDWRRYHAMLLGFRGKLILAFLLVAVIPLIVFGYYNREFAVERQTVTTSKQLNEDLELVQQRIVSTVSDEEDFRYGINSDYCETIASDYGVDFTVYRRAEIQASSRPELYQSGILDSRLPGMVFAELLVAGKGYAQTNETIGEVAYAVGYKPLVLNGVTLGVLSVPTLYRQQEIESELAERNAFTIGVYGILLVLTTIAGVVLANQLSQPIRDLTSAAHDVGGGKLDTRVPSRGSGEMTELIGTFNEMVGELKKSREELSRVEREKAWKEMAKQVAHEIKNPLTPMKLSVQHLQQAFHDRAENLQEIVERVTQTITEQIDTLARIATEFSHFARMPERRFERVNLHALLNETVQLFGQVNGIVFRTNYADTDPVLVADKEELRRVFVNIVRNSVQAMEQGGEISIATVIHDHRCTIRISDTGAGIPSELVSKVFQPNFSTKTDGMGLGLAIVRKVIEDLNGSVLVSSTVGAGTSLEIDLPLQTGSHD